MKIKNQIFTFGLPILGIILMVFTMKEVLSNQARKPVTPVTIPVSTELKQRIAGIGIIEPKSEMIQIGTHLPGIVQQLHVIVGQHVKAGDPLFTIDERDIKSQLNNSYAKLASAKLVVQDTKSELGFYEAVTDSHAISPEELSRKRFAAKRAIAALKEVESQIQELETTRSRLTVTSPIAGEILRVNTRIGQYASEDASGGLIILGDTSTLHLRVEIDETDAQRVGSALKAQGALRGQGDKMIPLIFVRVEPMIKAKRSLTGDGNERVDTRVLEVIYSFDKLAFNAYPGQQMDVFIESEH
jgi:HlyD family secretion protein